MRHGLIVAIFFASLAARSASAQIGSGLAQPPVFEQVDQNGVEIQTGRLARTIASISIGPGGPGSLSFSWTTTNLYAQAAFGYVIVKQDPQNPSKDIASVTAGGSTETFSAPHGTNNWTQDQGRASTLTFSGGTYIWTGSDGSVALFGGGSILIGTGPFNSPIYATRVNSLTYPAGQRLDYYYDCSGACNVRAVTSSLGYQLRLIRVSGQFNSAVLFNMNSETCDPNAASCTLTGTWPSLTWNAGTSSIVDSTGRSIKWTIDAYPNTTQHKFEYPSGRTLTYNGTTTNNVFKVSSFTDGKGTWNYQYPGQFGGVSTISNPDHATARVVLWSTTTGLVSSDQPAANNPLKTTYTYDTKSRLTNAKLTDGTIVSETRYGYDTRGNVNEVRQISTTPGTPADIVTTAIYPATCTNPKTCNKPISTTDARLKTTDYTYDTNHGGVLTVTQPAPTTGAIRPQTRYTYTQLSANYRNGSGTIISGPPVYMLTGASKCATQASCSGTADEVKTTISYGANDALMPTSTSSGDGTGTLTATVAMTYLGTGDVKTVDGPLAGTADTTRNYYDAMRRPLGSIGPDPDGAGALKRRAVRNIYDNDGRPTTNEIGTATGQGDNDLNTMTVLQQQVTAYDAQGRASTIRSNAGGTTYALLQRSYSNAGSLLCQAVRMNSATFGSPPADACVLATQGSFGPDRITRFTYNSHFRVTSVTSADGTSDAAVEVANTYDNQGRLATAKDAENNLTTYEYDGMNRLERIRYPVPTKGANQSSTTDFEQLGYDPNGSVILRRLRDGTSIAFTFDNLNRVTLKNLPGSEPDVTYAYDNLGRLTSASQTGHALSFTYDALSRNLTQVGPQGTVGSQWDLAGHRTRLIYPGSGLYVDYDYLITGEMTKMRENGVTSGVGVLATFAYDDLGRRTSLTFGNGVVQTITFDPVSRLSTLTNDLASTTNDLSATFAYNPASQIASTVRTGDAYAWTAHYNQNRNYTANGLNQYTASGAIIPTYDTRGNLTSAGTATYGYTSENMLVAASGSALATLSYDPRLRLYQVTAGSATTRFVYDGLDLIAEYNATNALLRRHVHGPGIDQPLVWYEGSGTTDRRFLSSDERGSIVSVTDGSGALLAIDSYDEYGIPGLTNVGRFQYTGQVWLPELGLQYSKNRIYSPTLGRFLQTDPIGYGDGMNMNAYVHNDPVNFTDPLGLSEQWCGYVNQPPPPATHINRGEIVVTASSSGTWWCGSVQGDVHVFDNTLIDAWKGKLFNLEGDEQFFKRTPSGIDIVNPAEKHECPGGDDAYYPPKGFFGRGDDVGHTHAGHEPYLGVDDGVSARHTGTSFMVSSAGVYRVNKDASGVYSVSLLDGRWGASGRYLRSLVDRWNKFGGASRPGGVTSGGKCKVIPLSK